MLRRLQFISELQAPRAGVPPPPREQHLLPAAAPGHAGLGVWQLLCSVSVLVELPSAGVDPSAGIGAFLALQGVHVQIKIFPPHNSSSS